MGYSHGLSSFAGGKGMYMASIGYMGSFDSSSPICSDEVCCGDAPHTSACGVMSVHRADCTSAADLLDMLSSCACVGEDWVMSAIRMLHGANLYCSSALGLCACTLE